MAEQPEHEFLKHHTTKVLDDFSQLRLYRYTETERRRFDFACLLERDWSRPMVGQVLWKHTRGMEKDLRTLITDGEAEVKVYVARDLVQSRQKLEEILAEYRASGRFPDLFRLKTIWVPPDFDADKEEQRDLVGEIVRSHVVEDILFSVVFGNLTREHVFLFLSPGEAASWRGLTLALLYAIATEGSASLRRLSDRFEVSRTPVRGRLAYLSAAGLVAAPEPGFAPRITSRGRVFLEILQRLSEAMAQTSVGPELSYVLAKLGCEVVPDMPQYIQDRGHLLDKGVDGEATDRLLYFLLLGSICCVRVNFGVDLANLRYWKKPEPLGVNKVP